MGELQKVSSETLKAGAAHVQAGVMELRPSGLVPLPVFHATQDRDITLVSGSDPGRRW